MVDEKQPESPSAKAASTPRGKVDIRLSQRGVGVYQEVLSLQEELFQQNVAAKLKGATPVNHLIFCEHPPVYTLGKSGDLANLLVGTNDLNAEFYRTNRGGDVTFHGLGQLVVYPVLDLEQFEIGLAKYIFNLEEVILQTIAEYGLQGTRLPAASGVWLDAGNSKARKICAIGVKASRQITMHGLAVNINTDLRYFDKIVPCGLADTQVTSLEQELNRKVPLGDFSMLFLKHFETVFGANIITPDSDRV